MLFGQNAADLIGQPITTLAPDFFSPLSESSVDEDNSSDIYIELEDSMIQSPQVLMNDDIEENLQQKYGREIEQQLPSETK